MVLATDLTYLKAETMPENLNFLGICLSKACVKAKAEAKVIKAQSKADVKVAKAQAKADSKVALAQNGIDTSFGSYAAKALGGASSLLTSLFGAKTGGLLGGGTTAQNSTQQTLETQQPVPNAQPANNTGLFIGLGVAAVVIGLIVWAFKRK